MVALKPNVTLSVLLAVLMAASGCLFATSRDLGQGPATLSGGHFTHDLEVHIVLVGFSEFDEASLRENLPQPLPPFLMIRRDVTLDDSHDPLNYRINYRIHRAPVEFATALFEFAKTTIITEAPDAYLTNYDLRTEKRVCTRAASMTPVLNTAQAATCKPIQKIDGDKVEAWIAENRAAAGLEFPGAGYSVFVLDSYTNGFLPKDSYHQYRVADAAPNPSMSNLRAWGGANDFVFLDVSAAPNALDYYPWANMSRNPAPAPRVADEPIWAYAKDMGPFYENLGKNIFDATRMLWARMPIYPIEYAEKYVLPMYIITEPNAHYNPKSPLRYVGPGDIERHTNPEIIQRAFQELAPWAEVELRLKFIHLPDGDKNLAAAVADAKSRFSESYMDYGVLKKYFRENWAKYVPEVPGAIVYPTFAFVVDFPSTGLYAYSDSDELGHSWGVFVNAADMWFCNQPTRPICFSEDYFGGAQLWWAWWNGLLIHELGHSFGLTHPHDTSGLDDKGFTTYELNWLWDSTASIMTYRHSRPHFDRFDMDLIYRSHTVNMAVRILEDPTSSPERKATIESALGKLQAGEYAAAFEQARAVWGSEPLRLRENLGVPGPAKSTPVKFATTACPAGGVPLPVRPPFVPVGGVPNLAYMVMAPCMPDAGGLTVVDVPLEIPKGAKALRIEYKEAAAPTHHRWSVYPEILTNDEKNWLSYLYNNGYDVTVLTDLSHCEQGCKVRFWGVSGVNTAYTLTVTPYT